MSNESAYRIIWKECEFFIKQTFRIYEFWKRSHESDCFQSFIALENFLFFRGEEIGIWARFFSLHLIFWKKKYAYSCVPSNFGEVRTEVKMKGVFFITLFFLNFVKFCVLFSQDLEVSALFYNKLLIQRFFMDKCWRSNPYQCRCIW